MYLKFAKNQFFRAIRERYCLSEGQIQHDGIPCTGINQLPQVIVSHQFCKIAADGVIVDESTGFPVDGRETNVPTGQKLVEGCFADELKGLRECLLSVYCGVRWSAKPSDKKFMFEIRTNLAKPRLVIVFQILAYSALPSPYYSSLKFCTLKKTSPNANS